MRFNEIVGCFLCLIIVNCIQAEIVDHARSKRQSSASNAALQNAVAEVQRQSLLTDQQFLFDFAKTANTITENSGGKLVSATATTFPALIGHKIAMTVGYIAPCGINLPHTHPRATEILFAVSGSFRVGFWQQDGARFITNTIDIGQATIFPSGSIHFQQNLNCTPTTFVAVFNSADPGVQTIASAFYGGLPAEIVGASLGGLNVDTIEKLKKMIPNNPTLGLEECRKRCGL